MNHKRLTRLKMNMFQLFHALPRDLQWEVLSVFVGSHSVRKGKLIGKIVRDTIAIPRIRRCHIYLYNRDYHAETYVSFRDGSQLMFCEDPVSGNAKYTHRRPNRRSNPRENRSYACQHTPLIVSDVVLPPYVKNVYHSYQDTDKKKAEKHPELKPMKPLTLTLPTEESASWQPSSPDGPPPGYYFPPHPRSPDGPPPPLL